MRTKEETLRFREYKKDYYKRNRERIRKWQNAYRKKYYAENKDKVLTWNKKSYRNNKKKHLILTKRWYHANKEKAYQYHLTMKRKWPWRFVYRAIKTRCENYKMPYFKYYGGRGIKCKITEEEIKKIWFRDKAHEMKKPSIDRINADGNYEFSNCQFIEHRINASKSRRRKRVTC